jgi:serine/threonine-protein kinase
MKGKLRYMAPEQVTAKGVDRRTDVFAAGIVLWETLTGRTLFEVPDGGAAAVINKVINATIVPPSAHRPEVASELDAVVMRALAREPEERYQTAAEFAEALEDAVRIPTARTMGRWVVAVAGDVLDQRAEQIAEIEARAGNADLDTISEEMLSSLSGQIVRKSLPPGPNDRTIADTPAEPRRALATDVTHVTGASTAEQRRSRRWIAALAVLLLGAVAVGAWFFLAPGLDQPKVASPTPVDDAPAPPGTDSSGPVGTATIPAEAQADGTASADLPQSGPRPAASQRWVPRPRPKPDCSNPTYVNAEGIKVFRKECL